MPDGKGIYQQSNAVHKLTVRNNRILVVAVCLLVLTGFMNIGFGKNNPYVWIEDMTTCPKAEPNIYPAADPEALALFKKAADADRAIPKTTPQQEIVKLYQKSAALGYWLAMHNLAMSYYQGDGIEEDEEKALYWFKEIEKLDIPEGYTSMALVYRKGIGVPVDLDKYREYLIKAARAGDADSQFYLGHDLYEMQRQNKIYQSYALKMWQCAADQGHKQAHFFLAIHYEDDNPSTAYRYYLRGAKAGDGGCLRALANAYGHEDKEPTFNLQQDNARSVCLINLNEKVRDNPDLTFPNLDELCPGTVPQPNEMK
ncbi:MAG: tetratricopeptide repeat protein [Proteobacteria bacterium]|nr:tetratricopeptide repeat protein [Pseudomonadota bacterium]